MLNEIKKTNRDRVKYALLLISFHFSDSLFSGLLSYTTLV